MSKSEELFQEIVKDLIENYDGTSVGKMMSSPAVQYNKKVFCFFYNGAMCFKLGKDRDIVGEYSIKDYDLLSPFKNKAPLAGWFIIPNQYSLQWKKIAIDAYEAISN